MSIKIITISDSNKHFSTAIDEYIKRLGKNINIISLKPEKNWETNKIIQKDTQNVINALKKDSNYKILMSKEWILLDSLEFAQTIKKNNLTFIIWAAYWLDESHIAQYIDIKISFWKITLPHWLAQLTLLEQIYRANQINTNKSYHY